MLRVVIRAAPTTPSIDKYELLDEIGHGGMATVYRARDRRLGREVALKLIHPHLRESPEVAARFVAEARAVAKLRHPNIVGVYDISDDTEPEQYLVAELIRGTTLRELLRSSGALPVELGVLVSLEVAKALAHAHGEQVIHRDIKPENVLIELPQPDQREDPETKVRIKLTDFGIAKLLDAQGVTSTGQVLGSPAHMAPEQIEGADVDVRADVFGLGVLLYECVVGHLPFTGKNPAQVLRAVLDGQFLAPDREQPKVGARYGNIISRALAREPAGRFRTVEEFAAALQQELDEVGYRPTLRELCSVLNDPPAYEERTRAEVATRLVAAGERARREKDVARATAHFNRALAYEPGNKEVLARISGIRRANQLRRGAALVAAFGGLILVGGAAALWLPTPQATVTKADPEPSAVAAKLPTASPKEPVPSPIASEAPIVEEKKKPRPVKAIRIPHAAEGTGEERSVRVRITGATGGGLRIDGEKKEWFGVSHQLTVGPHTFEFVPPNESCCVGSKRHVVIEGGEGVQEIVGSITFRDAVLRTSGQATGELSCPTLFSGVDIVPGQRSIPLGRAEATGSCTFKPQGSAPIRKLVTLRAGQTTDLSLP